MQIPHFRFQVYIGSKNENVELAESFPIFCLKKVQMDKGKFEKKSAVYINIGNKQSICALEPLSNTDTVNETF